MGVSSRNNKCCGCVTTRRYGLGGELQWSRDFGTDTTDFDISVDRLDVIGDVQTKSSYLDIIEVFASGRQDTILPIVNGIANNSLDYDTVKENGITCHQRGSRISLPLSYQNVVNYDFDGLIFYSGVYDVSGNYVTRILADFQNPLKEIPRNAFTREWNKKVLSHSGDTFFAYMKDDIPVTTIDNFYCIDKYDTSGQKLYTTDFTVKSPEPVFSFEETPLNIDSDKSDSFLKCFDFIQEKIYTTNLIEFRSNMFMQRNQSGDVIGLDFNIRNKFFYDSGRIVDSLGESLWISKEKIPTTSDVLFGNFHYSGGIFNDDVFTLNFVRESGFEEEDWAYYIEWKNNSGGDEEYLYRNGDFLYLADKGNEWKLCINDACSIDSGTLPAFLSDAKVVPQPIEFLSIKSGIPEDKINISPKDVGGLFYHGIAQISHLRDFFSAVQINDTDFSVTHPALSNDYGKVVGNIDSVSSLHSFEDDTNVYYLCKGDVRFNASLDYSNSQYYTGAKKGYYENTYNDVYYLSYKTTFYPQSIYKISDEVTDYVVTYGTTTGPITYSVDGLKNYTSKISLQQTGSPSIYHKGINGYAGHIGARTSGILISEENIYGPGGIIKKKQSYIHRIIPSGCTGSSSFNTTGYTWQKTFDSVIDPEDYIGLDVSDFYSIDENGTHEEQYVLRPGSIDTLTVFNAGDNPYKYSGKNLTESIEKIYCDEQDEQPVTLIAGSPLSVPSVPNNGDDYVPSLPSFEPDSFYREVFQYADAGGHPLPVSPGAGRCRVTTIGDYTNPVGLIVNGYQSSSPDPISYHVGFPNSTVLKSGTWPNGVFSMPLANCATSRVFNYGNGDGGYYVDYLSHSNQSFGCPSFPQRYLYDGHVFISGSNGILLDIYNYSSKDAKISKAEFIDSPLAGSYSSTFNEKSYFVLTYNKSTKKFDNLQVLEDDVYKEIARRKLGKNGEVLEPGNFFHEARFEHYKNIATSLYPEAWKPCTVKNDFYDTQILKKYLTNVDNSFNDFVVTESGEKVFAKNGYRNVQEKSWDWLQTERKINNKTVLDVWVSGNHASEVYNFYTERVYPVPEKLCSPSILYYDSGINWKYISGIKPNQNTWSLDVDKNDVYFGGTSSQNRVFVENYKMSEYWKYKNYTQGYGSCQYSSGEYENLSDDGFSFAAPIVEVQKDSLSYLYMFADQKTAKSGNFDLYFTEEIDSGVLLVEDSITTSGIDNACLISSGLITSIPFNATADLLEDIINSSEYLSTDVRCVGGPVNECSVLIYTQNPYKDGGKDDILNYEVGQYNFDRRFVSFFALDENNRIKADLITTGKTSNSGEYNWVANHGNSTIESSGQVLTPDRIGDISKVKIYNSRLYTTGNLIKPRRAKKEAEHPEFIFERICNDLGPNYSGGYDPPYHESGDVNCIDWRMPSGQVVWFSGFDPTSFPASLYDYNSVSSNIGCSPDSSTVTWNKTGYEESGIIIPQQFRVTYKREGFL